LLDQAASSAGAPLTQAEIAARLGTAREMIGRSLKLFEAQGLIRLDRGVITILDRAGLAEQHAE
ncbi:Crp/Fnr family transcriptional regulator, partial [Kouleothrix aurantiaca]